MLKKLQSKKGFTLMEMLIVVAIIAVLLNIKKKTETKASYNKCIIKKLVVF